MASSTICEVTIYQKDWIKQKIIISPLFEVN
jgi:hypothetical protein